MALAVALLGSTGCGEPRPSGTAGTTTSMSSTGETESESSTTTPNDTETGSNTSVTTLDTDDEAEDTNVTSGSFYAGPEVDFTSVSECDSFAQDCPDGEKCVPYSSAGDGFDGNKCVFVTGSGAAGDPCVYGGIIEATDDCDQGTYCWVTDDTNTGICVEFCEGTPNDPTCPMDIDCLMSANGTVNLCVPSCDPLLQDCTEGSGCYFLGDDFMCGTTLGNIPVGEPCGWLNDCAAGLACLPGELMPDCAGDMCCAAYCDLGAPMCEQMGTECIPFFDTDPPAGLEDVGVCLLPA